MIQFAKVLYDIVTLKGGLDQITPPLSLPPGYLRDASNFECAPSGGYARIGGYECFDGRAAPSAATYIVVQVSSFTNTPTVGQTLTGATSGATGKIIALGTPYMVLTQIAGTFTSTEVVQVGVTVIGTAVPQSVTVTAMQAAQYTNLAADVYRALIVKPVGSGAIRGVFGFTVAGVDQTYCFRDNAGATAVNLWRATAAGWAQITFKNEIAFTTGSVTTPLDGETLTQGGVSAVVRRVMTSSGTWAGTTAAGRFVIENPTGGNFGAGAAALTSGATVVLAGVQTAITMLPGGKFELVQGNFSGQAGTIRIYGVDGVNRMFEFDGTTLAPIRTGLTTDTPKHIVIHKNHLMCSYLASVFYAGPGTPFRFLAVDGGGEIATGDNITGFLVQPGEQTTGTLAIFSRSATNMLYGIAATTWNLTAYNTGTGAMDFTAQNLSQSYVLDDRGVISIATSLVYGNFEQSTLTNAIKTFITNERSKVAYSAISRERSQYRLFFNDGNGLYITVVNGKLLGCMPVTFPTPANVAWEWTKSNGDEAIFIGGTDGHVYQLDVGSSFDGANIDAFITLNWNNMRSPRLLKRFRHASVEMQGNFYAAITFGYLLGYGTTEISQDAGTLYASSFVGAPSWDTFTWDNFVWDGRTLIPTEVDVTGTAENIQVTIASSTDYIYPYTVNSVSFHYTPRRGLR